LQSLFCQGAYPIIDSGISCDHVTLNAPSLLENDRKKFGEFHPWAGIHETCYEKLSIESNTAVLKSKKVSLNYHEN
jgi:hypothetical protein